MAGTSISPIIAGMAAKKPKSEMPRAQILIEEIRRLQLRSLELIKEAQEIVDKSGVENKRSGKSKN
jgi:hypothetical protein